MTTKRPGRPSKHEWADKRDLCYQLYIVESKSLKEVGEYFSEQLGLADIPSNRDFSRQFTRWRFPARRDKLSEEEETRLVERIKQLWEQNYVQKQMLDSLTQEGWNLDPPALARLRRKHGIMLRVAAGYNRENMGPGTGKKRKHADVVEKPKVLEEAPEQSARRAERVAELQAQSDAQFNSRKRRRRIRGLAHLPPDAPGLPPRYKSETSLDECKVFLNLNNDMYKQIRDQFEAICTEKGIIKKGLCSSGAWSEAKTQLIRESVHLSAVLNPVHGEISSRENALEVICSDVTKRMRNMQKRILLKEANNILGINPEESKEIRRQFYEILRRDGFQTMLLCGKEHYDELKQEWFGSSELVQRLYEGEMTDLRKRCIDVLLRDATKRHNDNNVSKLPHLVEKTSYGPGPGPARKTAERHERIEQLDPALFAALSQDLRPTTQAVPVFYKLSSASTITEHPKVWLATLQRPDMDALRGGATGRSNGGRMVKISGVIRDELGSEDLFQIDDYDELSAYLETVRNAHGKATFVVVLEK